MKRIVKDPVERKADIINAARQLFLSKEYDRTTMQDVMHYLGIAKGTIYHYFASKEDLLEAVVINMVDCHLAKVQGELKKVKGNAIKKIKKLVKLGNMADEHSDLQNLLHKPTNSAMHLRILVETINKFVPIYEELILQGCNEGVFQTKHPKECAEFILSAIQFLTDTGIYNWTSEELKRRSKAFPSLIEQQLNAPKGSFKFLSSL